MGRLLGKQACRDALVGLALLCAALALVLWPTQGVEAARDGLVLCANVIVPSLFPFFVLSSLLVELGLARYLGRMLEGVMVPLFRVGGNCAAALALGFIGGYPVGAKTAISLYQKGQCSRTEAERLLAFCNNSGPAFILGVVGAGVFGSGRVGLMLYLSHILASFCVGILFRFYRPGQSPTPRRALPPTFQTSRFSTALTRSVTSAVGSVLNICAFVVLFTVVIRMLTLSGLLTGLAGLLGALFSPLGVTQEWITRLLTGFLEVSSGVSTLSGQAGLSSRVSMAAFMLGWAGLSVHCQVLAFLGDSGLSMGTYFVGKLLHGVLSVVTIGIMTHLFPLEAPVSAYLVEQVEGIASLNFHRSLAISGVAAAGVWGLFLFLAVWAGRKRTGKTRWGRV